MRVLYIGQLAEPDLHDLSIYEGLADGPTDADWFVTRLNELGIREHIELDSVDVCLGDEVPDAADYEAVIIGGSYHMVGERRPWQERLLEWIDRAWDSGVPCLGICGGHQLMGIYFGATVEPVADGPWCETGPVDWTPAGTAHWLMADVYPDTGFHFGNTEAVSCVPEGASVLATRYDSPAVALDFGKDWIGIQFHPEMSAAGMMASWRESHPERMKRYQPSPVAARLLLNFLRRAGLADSDVERPKKTA